MCLKSVPYSVCEFSKVGARKDHHGRIQHQAYLIANGQAHFEKDGKEKFIFPGEFVGKRILNNRNSTLYRFDDWYVILFRKTRQAWRIHPINESYSVDLIPICNQLRMKIGSFSNSMFFYSTKCCIGSRNVNIERFRTWKRLSSQIFETRTEDWFRFTKVLTVRKLKLLFLLWVRFGRLWPQIASKQSEISYESYYDSEQRKSVGTIEFLTNEFLQRFFLNSHRQSSQLNKILPNPELKLAPKHFLARLFAAKLIGVSNTDRWVIPVVPNKRLAETPTYSRKFRKINWRWWRVELFCGATILWKRISFGTKYTSKLKIERQSEKLFEVFYAA